MTPPISPPEGLGTLSPLHNNLSEPLELGSHTTWGLSGRGKGRESPGQWSSALTFTQSLGDQAPALEMQIPWVWLRPLAVMS